MSRRCKIAILAILTLKLCVVPAWAGNNAWTVTGPTGGAIRAVLVEDPTAASAGATVYVGTLGSGVFKSVTGGAAWAPSGLDGVNIRALARDPTTVPTPTLYAGGENAAVPTSGGVFSSQDGGANWVPVDAAGLTNKQVQALAFDGVHLYAGTAGGGVFRLDAGTWTQINNGLAALPGSDECGACALQVLSLATDSRAAGTVYAGTEGNGVYKSTDSGANWARHPSTTNQGFRSDCLEKAEIQAVLVDETQPNDTLYVGAKGMIGDSGCGTVINAPAVGQGPGLFRISNTDPLWDRKMNGMYGDQVPPTTTLNVYALAAIGGRIYAGTDFGVFTSNDLAQSWDGVPRMHGGGGPVPSNLVGLPIRALGASLNSNITTLYAGSVGRGMFRREHTGASIGDQAWIEKNSGLTALRAKSVAIVPIIAQPGTSRVLAGLSSGGIIKSDDGVTWLNTTETPPPTHYPAVARTVNGIAVDPSDLTTVYAATGRGVIKSTDRGDTWTPMVSGLPTEVDPAILCCSGQVNPLNFTVPRNVQSIAVDPANLDVLYAAVGGVYTSVNGGNWVALNGSGAGPFLPSTVTSGDKVSALVVDPNSGDPIFGTLYAATSGFGVFKSVNGGGAWTPVNNGFGADLSITALALDPLPDPGAHTVYAATSTGRVFRTDNGGLNWALGTLPRGLPGNKITALAIRIASPRAIYAALSGAGVYESLDGAANWHVFNNSNAGLALDVASVAVDGTQTPQTLYAATLGRGMHDFEIFPPTPPDIIVQSPGSPYPFEAPASDIPVVATGLNTTAMFWSTNRGHAGPMVNTGGQQWTASSVPLETGLNLITLTAVNASSSASSTSLTVNLSGTPVIFVSPSSIPFGTVAVGGVSPLQTVTVRNDGTADLIIGTITLGGTNPNQFSKIGSKDLCSGVTLAPTLTCTVGVKFVPTNPGAQNATLQIPSNDPVTNPATVGLSGTGSGGGTPVIFWSPPSIPFGTVAVGGLTSLQNVTVRNDGTANLVLGTITLGGTNPNQFVKPGGKDFCSGVTLAPSVTCTVGFKFMPTSSGAKNATVQIPSNDPVTNPATAALSGTGAGAAPEITVTPTSLAFGSLAVGGVSSLQNVTVRNDGTANLIVGTITVGGTDADQFRKIGGKDFCSGVTLGPGLSCTVGVKFIPTLTGLKAGTLVIPSNDSDEPSVTVTLSGTGT